MSGRLTQDATGVSHVFPIGSRLNEAGRLEVGGCDVVELAREFGTPAYVYSSQAILDNFRAYTESLGDLNNTVCYAVKANSSLGILSLLANVHARSNSSTSAGVFAPMLSDLSSLTPNPSPSASSI